MEIELFDCLKKKIYHFLIKKVVSAHNREFEKVRNDILYVFLRVSPQTFYIYTIDIDINCPAFLQLLLYNENFLI